MSGPRTILITGATGKQGRSVIEAVKALPPNQNDFHIIALVRDPNAPSAQSLAKLPNVSLLQGDLNDPHAAFTKCPTNIWGVYSVQINSDAELAQGTSLVNAAIAHGVRHFVYASGDRGGSGRSDQNPTNVKNFAAKFTIEQHLRVACGVSSTITDSENREGNITYTILRPVSFFENLTRDIHGKGFARMWMQMQDGQKKLQLVSTRDIGWFAAQAFANCDAPEYKNKAISLAGDELSALEAERIFKEVTGKDMPMSPCVIGKGVKYFKKDTVGDMFAWFEHEGYGADVVACRKANPDMLDYRTWLTKYSAFVRLE